MTIPSIDSSDIAKIASQSFTLPDICIKIRQMLDDQKSDLDGIGNLIAMDPALSSKLLKLANSPLFRFEAQIDSLSKAINIIGGEALYNLVMVETASSAFEHFSSDVINLRRFWLQSIYAALVAKHLAKIIKLRGSERFFLLGLLHNVGELLVAINSPSVAIKCNQYSKEVSPWKLQQQILGFNYAHCSANLLKFWNLPSQLYIPVEHAHNENVALEHKETALMYIAIRASVAMSHTELYSVGELINPKVMQSLNLEQDDIQDAIKFAHMEAANVLGVISPKFNN